ncbi:hypothetical protein KKP97_01370 [Methanothermococcus sp. SCGC AD-155-C09]|nr:hypothetical protein [Methanothermococcus sp. SCGC AD-155-C09]
MGKKFVSLGLIVILIIGMVSISGCIREVSKPLFKKISKVVTEGGDELAPNTPVKAKISKPVEEVGEETLQTQANAKISKAVVRDSINQTLQNSSNVTFLEE